MLKFLLTFVNYEITLTINLVININSKFVFIYKVWFSTVTAFFLNSKAFSFHSVSILKTIGWLIGIGQCGPTEVSVKSTIGRPLAGMQ